MPSRFQKFFRVPTVNTMLKTEAALYKTYHDEPRFAHNDFELYQDQPPKTLSQQFINDLADLRKNTTIVGRNPAEEALCRLMRPLFEPNASLAWPPAPHKYDSYSDRGKEETNSPSVWSTSQRSTQWNEGASAVESLELLRDPPQYYGELYRSPIFNPPSPAPAPRMIPHIIGEDDPFNPFSYDILLEDKNERRIDTANGMVFAPVPRHSTVAALANFEVIAMAPPMGVAVEKEPSSNQNDSVAGSSIPNKEPALHEEAFVQPSAKTDKVA